MTNEEAKRILMSDADFSGAGEKAKLTAEALCVAVKALEKQIAFDDYQSWKYANMNKKEGSITDDRKAQAMPVLRKQESGSL